MAEIFQFPTPERIKSRFSHVTAPTSTNLPPNKYTTPKSQSKQFEKEGAAMLLAVAYRDVLTKNIKKFLKKVQDVLAIYDMDRDQIAQYYFNQGALYAQKVMTDVINTHNVNNLPEKNMNTHLQVQHEVFTKNAKAALTKITEETPTDD